MLQISTRGRYGIRAIMELADSYDKNLLSISTISRRQQISEKYLHSILSILHNEGTVTSVRGKNGGFKLARPPSEITLKSVLLALESPGLIVDCVKDPSHCSRSSLCTGNRVWRYLGNEIENILDRLSIADIVNETYKAE